MHLRDTILRFVDIICRNYTISYNIRSFLNLSIGMIFEMYILSSRHKLVNADPAGTLESFSGTQNEQKIYTE